MPTKTTAETAIPSWNEKISGSSDDRTAAGYVLQRGSPRITSRPTTPSTRPPTLQCCSNSSGRVVSQRRQARGE
jgi:hypothetical protein